MEFAESALTPVASAYKESNESSITPLDFFIAIDVGIRNQKAVE